MVDREKVVSGLHCCANIDGANCESCPYYISDSDCSAQMSMDALELLKEQEKIINELEERLRLLEYGDQDILQGGLMPAT